MPPPANEGLAGFDRTVTGHHDSLFLARLRLRDLAEDYLAQAFEELLHAARFRALFGSLGRGADSQDVLQALQHVVAEDPAAREMAELMARSHYLDESPV